MGLENYEPRSTIVHIGMGNFVRAHFARYMQEYHDFIDDSEWKICGIDRDTQRTRELIKFFEDSNYSYELDAVSDNFRETLMIHSIVELINQGSEVQKALNKMAHPTTKIVSLTVTEKGYSCDLTTGKLIISSEVEHDITDEGSKKPKSMLGLVVEALRIRKANDGMPFTLMSLDNIPGNGNVLRNAILEFTQKRNLPELVRWIESNVTFPNTMVDRITPNTKSAEDPVKCEPFRMWVVEDSFCNGRPMWELIAGPKLILTKNVIPYEHVKIRLLNGSHSALSFAAYLAGYRSVADAMADPRIKNYIKAFMEEVLPTVNEVPGITLNDYCSQLIERFSNTEISDKVSRLCEDGSMKANSFWKPVIKDLITRSKPMPVMGFAVAAWIRYSVGIDDKGESFEIVDPAMKNTLQRMAQDALSVLDVTPFLKTAFGSELGNSKSFQSAVQSWFKHIAEVDDMDALFSGKYMKSLGDTRKKMFYLSSLGSISSFDGSEKFVGLSI